MAEAASARQKVTAVERSFALLESFRQGESSATLTALASRSGLPASTAHRLLATLIDCGYVVSVGDGRYRLGLKAWQLGCRAVGQLDLPSAIQPQLERLAAASGETVHVSVLQGAEVVYVARVTSSRRVAAQTYLGQSAPAHCTATGKALLAFSPAAVVDRVLAGELPATTPKTVTAPDEIRRLLDDVRRTGIARNFEQWQPDLAGVAAPIRDQSGHAIAAIGVAGPSYRFSPQAMEEASGLVRSVASELSELFGYLPDGPWGPSIGDALASREGSPA